MKLRLSSGNFQQELQALSRHTVQSVINVLTMTVGNYIRRGQPLPCITTRKWRKIRNLKLDITIDGRPVVLDYNPMTYNRRELKLKGSSH